MRELLDNLDKRIKDKHTELNEWISEHCKRILVPLYTSVDLRLSDNKLVPVDTNIFPAGFNNLSPIFQKRTGFLFKEIFSRKYPNSKKVLLIPELHTRNPYYWENIYVLKSILEAVDYEVKVGIVNVDKDLDKYLFKTSSGKDLEAFKVFQKDYNVYTNGFVPDLILINNDFSEKCPETLKDIVQPVVPPVEIGWHTRRKDVHFEFYNKLASEVSGILGIDPWTITIETRLLSDLNLDISEDRQRAFEHADEILNILKEEYLQRNINEKPFLFLKSNSGTYGMAVISVSDSEMIKDLNLESRKKMRVSKGGKDVKDVVLQEGVSTSITFEDDRVAEPVIYLVETEVTGAFYRINKSKTKFENLNSRGMEFVNFPYNGDESSLPDSYSLIAKIASIAAGYEIEKILKEGGCKEDN